MDNSPHAMPPGSHGVGKATRLSLIRDRLQQRWRSRRMREFARRMSARPGTRVLDVGGNIEIWSLIDHPFRVTLLNTSVLQADSARPWRLPACGTTWEFVEGDACDLQRFADRSFDIVFSNSVIEHLGDDERVERFAREVRRVGRSYWVQTPSYLFPIEAHTGWPFLWFYPRGLRESIARRLDARRANDPWFCPIAQTRYLTLQRMRQLFPEAATYTERVAGWPKSWSMYHVKPRP
ncbi:MAG: class I SAM-dependent methyltransferase [Vitreoscilla sp.]|nr:class I SAM-dependent methyltransferase [Vitreoscilla sp.]